MASLTGALAGRPLSPGRGEGPFLSFKSIVEKPERCAKVVSAEQFGFFWN